MKKKLLESGRLLQDLSNGSEEAFKSLYMSYSPSIIRYIHLFVKNRMIAEELTSDVFISIWENRIILPELQNFNAYIYKVAKFKILNYIRSVHTQNISLEDLPIDLFSAVETTPEDELITQEMVRKIDFAIHSLPARCKLAFKLVREDGMKYKDAAEHLGISVKTLEAHMTLAMKKIIEILMKD